MMLLLVKQPGLEELDEALQAEILAGIGTLIRSVAPLFLLCDRRDIGIAPRVRDPHFGCPALYVYDSAPGGSGLSEALAQKLNIVLCAGSERVRECTCEMGCPSCIGVSSTESGIKAETAALMNILSQKRN